eukprot:5772496-Amphidinium_carterae.1
MECALAMPTCFAILVPGRIAYLMCVCPGTCISLADRDQLTLRAQTCGSWAVAMGQKRGQLCMPQKQRNDGASLV